MAHIQSPVHFFRVGYTVSLGLGGAEGGGYRPINQPSAFSLSKHVAISASKDPLSVDLLKEFSWLIKIIIRFYIYASYK